MREPQPCRRFKHMKCMIDSPKSLLPANLGDNTMDYPTSDLQSFAARVKRLERHNLILKLLSAVTLVLLSALFAFEIGTRQSSPPDTIVTTHLVLRDLKAGHDGAELSFDKDGKAALHLFGLGADQGVNATH